METNCEAYEYNATDEEKCHLLNKTSFAAKTVFSDGKNMFTSKVRGLCQRYRTCDNRIYTGRERLIRSHSSARFCFELSGNSN